MSDSDSSPKREPLSAEQKQALVLQRKADAKSATQDYRADEQATRDLTAKLRAERLQREKAGQTEPKQRGGGRSKPR